MDIFDDFSMNGQFDCVHVWWTKSNPVSINAQFYQKILKPIKNLIDYKGFLLVLRTFCRFDFNFWCQ